MDCRCFYETELHGLATAKMSVLQATGNKTEQHGSINLIQEISAQNMKKRVFSGKNRFNLLLQESLIK
jgi:hypothetical protein